MQLQKLEFEIKLQKLTNELQELKRVSNTRENNNSETRQSPLERVINQARREGQDTSEILAFPVLEIEDQDNVIRQYQTLEFKVIKELKLAVAQYGPTAPFKQALLDTVIESNLTPQDWKTLCKTTLSEGDFLLWSSEWREASKRTATTNTQAGHPEWSVEMLLGEGLYEGNNNQIGFPIAVYAQIAVAARRAWNLLPSKGDLSGNLTAVKQAPDELFQDFVDRLLKTANRIFGNSQAGNPLVTQLAYENANAACREAIRPQRGKTDLAGYIRLCSEIGPSYNQGLAMAAALQGTTIQGILSQRRGNRRCFKCGSLGHFKSDCPDNKPSINGQSGGPAGTCHKCRKGNHWVKGCKSKNNFQGRPVSGNGGRGQPQAPLHLRQTVCGAQLLPSQGNPSLTSPELHQEMQDWNSVACAMPY
ncbi:endogenous retrovirus group K member 10 Gag polyprotein-like, partial [Apodemus sylvaticus]|uniref:endogenous retrovirus group K member 10 Gag polyprotein-like n=1 Tax=Apodemus sylvaticus TaxID=10129 RepID=UPI0022442E32